ncbi:type IV pilus twitching motility protein PilT [Legionella taurinensis]|uniref:PilT/PilU family type 4a pilus ATPase n=1 Tax=Legionella taurinensis TaxID=70611 RepID=A0A3A5LCB7_9GAMM|nr:PilT/PilU family type 4a pilus ATPase [Legionella taurinensis]MDX1837416.1 PilT/PilU family type 4a pilus ATPase [Legionella taurinensis]PUT40763.1 type IV pili twitching motility protein PilT [Legionella taurinensis]PUT44185.1 type IV pili twitching motility protein PilT [Legionella taurinensis]PUT47486.1 type IV pili twitching motility protein PilT [Legionella taurinensis]PUT48625.1 type IV pili twitching motility protein PilT [Legionella taurinensis]
MDITPFFKLMVDRGASDLFFSVGAPPNIKIEGITSPIGQAPLKSQQMAEIAASIMNDEQRKEFEATMELNMAISIGGIGRFRVNLFRQRGETAMVVRYIKGIIPTIEELQLPGVLNSIVMELRGLVLVVGSTSSGKSTTLAAMIDYRNENHRGHILTIEDPIEYLYKHKKSIVDQREVGIDTLDYDNALKNAMREAPDVILIGEIRDRNTMKHAISYAETGHLCLSTLHANNANQTMDRILNFFPEDARHQLLLDLSLNLRAIISLRLIPGLHKQRVPAVEIMINSPYIADLIEKGKVDEIKEVMARSREQGMQTFDQALFDLYKSGKISKENAIRFADSKNNVGLQIRLSEERGLGGEVDLTIEEDEKSKF